MAALNSNGTTKIELPETATAPERLTSDRALAQSARNDTHKRTRITRKDSLEKRMLTPSPSLDFSDAAPHPLVNRLSDDWREYMYLFLGCQSSILVDRPGELAGAGTPHRSSGPGAFLAILIGRGIPTRAAAHTSDVFVERVFQVLQEGGQARSKILERATGIEPVSEAWEASGNRNFCHSIQAYVPWPLVVSSRG